MELFHLDGMIFRNTESGHILCLLNYIQSCVLYNRRIWTHHTSASILHEKNNQTWKIGEQYTRSCVVGGGHRVLTEWQWPLSGIYSIMMERSALAGVGGGVCTPTPFHSFYHHVQSCSVRSSWEGRYTPPIFFISTPICTLWWRLFESFPRLCGAFLKDFPAFIN
jgi:hypothetical protein